MTPIRYDCEIISASIVDGAVHIDYVLNGPGFDPNFSNTHIWASEEQILGEAGIIIINPDTLRPYLATAYANADGVLTGKTLEISIKIRD